GDYVGIDVHRAARICEAAHGGQILASDATRIVLEQTPPEAVTLKSMGEHRLKDLLRPEQLFQVVHPDLRESFPPLRTLDAHPHNLPPQPTPLIGREAELEQTRAALFDAGVRLLTLTGPGGTGKTRLALQLAAQVIDRFRHGAFFVPLAHISDPEMVVPSVAQALGVNETPGHPLLHNLQEYLRDKQTLLLLDNLEQLQQLSFVVDRLLAASVELKIIATSRERLRLSWEHEFPVPMLEVPEQWKGDLDALSRNSAVALFVNRCRFVQRDFSLTPENAEAVATICARLEGLPLAIELAAARIKILSPQEIATRLDDQLRLLRGGPRDAPERHQSLQAAISWSYALLAPEEQRLFRRLAVFRGGFALESAEAIGDDDQIDMLDGLSSLVDKSLLRRIGAPGGATRFLMLETIREYGVERLAAEDELSEIRTAHARHFADLADHVEEHLIGPEEEDWMQRLGRDLENLRAAVEWSLQSEDRSAAARLAIGFGWLMYLRGYLTEGRARVSQIQDKVGDEPQLRARLMFPAGVLAWSLGDFDKAQGWLEGALRLFLEHGDAKRQAGVSAFLGHVARSCGRIDEANRLHHTALETYRSIGNEKGVAWALYDLGLAARDRGQDDEARALHGQSLALFRKLGYRWGMAWALWNLGVVAHRRGDDAAARDHFRESLELYRVLDDRRGIAQCLEGFAAVSFVAGRPAEATRLLAAADTLRTGLGAPLAVSDRREYDRILEGLKAALNSAEFDEEWRIGRTLDLDAAIHITLVTPSTQSPAARQTGKVRETLTPREREVATLVARGLSNRDIAAKLGVAERTAISHVEHIMNKLGLHSRAQIAAWAVRQGLDIPAD
ncbi:MAG: ATP-binding protein, partial [bacterium]